MLRLTSDQFTLIHHFILLGSSSIPCCNMIAIRHNQSYQECCKTFGSASRSGTPFQMIFQTCHMSSQEFHCQGHQWMTWFVWTPENLPWVYPGLLEEPWEPQSWPKSCQVRNEIPKTKTIPQSGRSRIRGKMQFRNDQWIELNPLQRTFASTGWIWGSRRQWTEAENTWHCLLKITETPGLLFCLVVILGTNFWSSWKLGWWTSLMPLSWGYSHPSFLDQFLEEPFNAVFLLMLNSW